MITLEGSRYRNQKSICRFCTSACTQIPFGYGSMNYDIKIRLYDMDLPTVDGIYGFLVNINTNNFYLSRSKHCSSG
ncbi:hypothetical protein A3218_21810 [Pseudomonas chlororaphis]|nr:hypothetical protein A3218_21810 [Pseudomonas chlororaphis]